MEKRCVTAAIYAGSFPSTPKTVVDIKEQVQNCWNFIIGRGWKVKYVFIDLSENGSLKDRANFQEMIKAAKTGKFDFVILNNLAYLCDSPSDVAAVTELMRRSGIHFRSLDKLECEIDDKSR